MHTDDLNRRNNGPKLHLSHFFPMSLFLLFSFSFFVCSTKDPLPILRHRTYVPFATIFFSLSSSLPPPSRIIQHNQSSPPLALIPHHLSKFLQIVWVGVPKYQTRQAESTIFPNQVGVA